MLDIRQNPNLSFIQDQIKNAELPAYVANAPLDELGVDADNIPASGFASTSDSTLPCHTKAACFVSRLYFEAQRPGLDSSLAEAVDAKLASFEVMHDIQQEELAKPIEAIKQASIQHNPPNMVHNRLQRLVNRSAEAVTPGEMIKACRELKKAGINSRMVNDWAFVAPMKSLQHHIEVLASNHESEKLASLATEMKTLTPRERQERLPEVADALFSELKMNQKVHKKLAEIPTQASYDLRLAGQEVPRDKVEPALTKVAELCKLPVFGELLQVPLPNWDQVVEQAPIDKQREILNLL